MSSQAATAERPGLLADERGAIMVMGLFMATMLIGAMWYMKGVGDAVVFRDHMQESADHVVFSSAAVHARGMNLIAVINIVMYVLVVIHVVLAMLKWMAFAGIFTVVCAIPCGKAYVMLDRVERAYDNTVIRFGLPALSIAGTAAAVGYPWYGSYAGYTVGENYKTMGIAAGPSNIPGFSFSLPLGQLFGGKKSPVGGNTNQASLLARSGSSATKGNQAEFSSDLKLGLPVTLAENKELCTRATDVVTELAPGPLGFLLKFIADAADDCDGGVWENKMFGWKKMYGPAKNGNDWLQVWSFAFPEKYDENFAESKVALAIGGSRGNTAAASLKASSVTPPMYFAQSEFYFDCEKAWDDDSCNGDETEASFNMRWRARMRNVKTPDFLGMILGALGDGLLGGLVDFALDAGADRIKGSKIFRDASAVLARKGRGLNQALGRKGADVLGDLFDDGKDLLGDAAKDAISDAIGNPAGAAVPNVLH